MGCTHPFGAERIRKTDGTPGVRCPACGSVAFEGDSFWRTLWEGLRMALGRKPRGTDA